MKGALTMELNIAICDDNEKTIKDESSLIHSVLEELNIKHCIDEYISPINLLQAPKAYDIVFLDIEMDELNGIQTANKLKSINKDCLPFFVTNHPTYHEEASNERPFRFWTKPIERRALEYGIKSAIKELQSSNYYINIKINNKKTPVCVQNIIYIYMENKRLHIITTKGELIADDTLKNVYSQIKDIDYFAETCRGYYVNLNFIKNHTHDTAVCIYKDTVHEVCISRRKYKNFRKRFIDWMVSR